MENRRNFLVKLAALFGAYLAPTSLLERGSSQAKSSTVNPIDKLDTSFGEAASGCFVASRRELFIQNGVLWSPYQYVTSRYYQEFSNGVYTIRDKWDRQGNRRDLVRWQFMGEDAQERMLSVMRMMRNQEYDCLIKEYEKCLAFLAV